MREDENTRILGLVWVERRGWWMSGEAGLGVSRCRCCVGVSVGASAGAGAGAGAGCGVRGGGRVGVG